VSAALIQDRFHTSVAHAGWLAGLSNGIAIFLCPLAGILMDYVGYKMWIQVLAGVLTTTAYLMLLSATVSPVPSLVLLAICVSFTPTILKSSVPNLVLPAVYGSVII
jgi:nitrate/nitrite transporter NarK